MRRLEFRLPRWGSGHHALIDELKGIAILLVVLYHAGGVLVLGNHLHGDLGVDIFLVLSGLGLTVSSRELPLGKFLARRAWRILPAYWIALGVFLWANDYFLQQRYTTGNIILHVLGIQDLGGDAPAFSINDSFWFITLILFLYPFFYYVRRLLTRLDLFVLCTGAISAAVALALFFLNQPGLMGHVGFRLPSFFLGMILGQGLRQGELRFDLSAWFGLGLLFYFYVPCMEGIILWTTAGSAGLVALYAFTLRPALSREPRIKGVLSWLGQHSLEIFLFHQPLMREYNRYLQGRWLNVPEPSPGALVVGMTVAVAVTLLISAELRKLDQRFLPA